MSAATPGAQGGNIWIALSVKYNASAAMRKPRRAGTEFALVVNVVYWPSHCPALELL